MPNIASVPPGAVAQSVAAADLGVGPTPAATGQKGNDNSLSPEERSQAASALSQRGMHISPTDVPGQVHHLAGMVEHFFQNAGAAAAHFTGLDKLPKFTAGGDINAWAAAFKGALGIGGTPTGQSQPGKVANGDGSFDISRF